MQWHFPAWSCCVSQESWKLEEWMLLKCIPADSGEATFKGWLIWSALASWEGILKVNWFSSDSLGFLVLSLMLIPLATVETNFVSKSNTHIWLFGLVLFVCFFLWTSSVGEKNFVCVCLWPNLFLGFLFIRLSSHCGESQEWEVVESSRLWMVFP